MANSLLLIQGDGQSAQLGDFYPNPLVLKVVDAANVGQSGQDVIFSVPTTAGVASGRFQPGDTTTYTTTSDSNGYVFATIKAVGAAGSWLGLGQLTAALGVTRNWTQTNLPVGPSTVAITTGTNLKAAINASYGVGALRATVRDGGGSVMSGIVVQFSVPAGHGTFTGGLTTVTATTDGTGIATAPTFTANATPGAFTVTVSVPVAAGVTTSTTWTNVDPAVPTTVQNIAGGGQQAAISSAFASALQARVTNGLGNPVSGVNVTFASPGTGQSCTFPGTSVVVPTDSFGYAFSPTPTANALTGSYFVTASATGATTAQFQLTNGASFLPEVCSAPPVAPTGTAQFGSGVASWVNPNNALNATGSTVTIPSALDASKTLRCSPLNSSLFGPIEDGAKITQFKATYEIKGTNGGGGQTSVLARLYNNTSNLSSSFTDITTTAFAAKAHNFAISSMTGAQLKAGNVGIGFLSQLSVGDATVRNVKLQVCYQNPDVPAATLAVPLQLCEA